MAVRAVMAKRIADKELTDRNWDQEDEGEEAGTFSIASEDVMKSRAIKKAKRRAASFSGFGNGAGFKPVSSLTNGNAASVAPSFTGFNVPASAKMNSAPVSFRDSKTSEGDVTPNGSRSSKEYNRQLTALNCSVRDWISKHVDENPLCDLNPIFRDYERHLASIDQKYGSSSSADAPKEHEPSLAAGSLVPAGGAPRKDERPSGAGAVAAPPGVSFNFGKKVDSSVLGALSSAAAPSFSFSTSTSSPGIPSFGSFTSGSQQPADENGEESEEPPVPVVKEIKEKDAFYSKKCKLFYKKDGEFKEKGVGTLHLKMVAESKLQLLVRADTNLGNILLNIMVPSSMPCSRTGKNNVMVVCVPNPPVDEKNPNVPVPVLIRVKTTQDADELHGVLLEKKA
ncbi:hypothetical protein DNTS_006118 [Danionella cerebrum]|uniref:Nuclear pore complex protein Nup50 n=1 Tax=Danionella cerebrum TaxID=2873325 RepID=A0A553NRA3_9TELE|nr:hypothetical protein DNTS_006118 [Danionella translucida]